MAENSVNMIRTFLAQSPLHRPLAKGKAAITERRIKRTPPKLNSRTIYIISPYKTGTTYISSLWDEKIVKHEPLHLYSLTRLGDDFDFQFKRREAFLNLELEASGFLSLYLKELPNPSTKYQYLYILRPPSKWVRSVIRHFCGRPELRKIGYEYIIENFWNELLGINILDLANEKYIKELVNRLFSLYFKLLNDAISNDNIYFVSMDHLDQLALRLGDRFGTPPDFSRAWRRLGSGTLRFDLPIDKDIDIKYEQILAELPKERFYV